MQQDGRGYSDYMPSQMNPNAYIGQGLEINLIMTQYNYVLGQPSSSIGAPRQGVPPNVSRAQSVPSQQQVPSFAQDTSHFMSHGPPVQQRNTSGSYGKLRMLRIYFIYLI